MAMNFYKIVLRYLEYCYRGMVLDFIFTYFKRNIYALLFVLLYYFYNLLIELR